MFRSDIFLYMADQPCDHFKDDDSFIAWQDSAVTACIAVFIQKCWYEQYIFHRMFPLFFFQRASRSWPL